MTNKETEVEAKQLAANYGYEKSQGLANSIVALCGRVREGDATIALEQRCERSTPWDMACVAIAQAIRAGGRRE